MTGDTTPPKYEFAKLDLKPGDILVLKINAADWREVTKDRIDKVRAAAEAKLPEGVFCLVIGPAIELTKITVDAGDVVEGKLKKGKKS